MSVAGNQDFYKLSSMVLGAFWTASTAPFAIYSGETTWAIALAVAGVVMALHPDFRELFGRGRAFRALYVGNIMAQVAALVATFVLDTQWPTFSGMLLGLILGLISVVLAWKGAGHRHHEAPNERNAFKVPRG